MKGCRLQITVGDLLIRIGFWGPLYYSYNKEPKILCGKWMVDYVRDLTNNGYTGYRDVQSALCCTMEGSREENPIGQRVRS